MGARNGRDYQKTCYRLGDFVKFSSPLVEFTHWHLP